MMVWQQVQPSAVWHFIQRMAMEVVILPAVVYTTDKTIVWEEGP